ncbi:SubName: Full=Uncharacterized protein {ECO:0000313/EMBL:CCA66526.1} [Serendipita indica DSM 11827]|uniref:SWR1-complex protein 4 n=1 Tax=Serendipita indica (strain DSM 11827) TaxID=1109443 RepID=G4T5D3_SERID|nr:SubName: Full=Uncharacterized protein {ECO:0000313/EMBL:CCA66526.1} [Serendipita indica DSM 11827]CCA66526.1 hypothetical protein PIIN_11747 [Serendipita indica DSM 11827]
MATQQRACLVRRLQQFSNTARDDTSKPEGANGLKLRHWSKVPFKDGANDEEDEYMNSQEKDAMAQDDGPYPFAKYTPKVDIVYSYTDEEYAAHLEDSAESGWTKAETDYLFVLLHEYKLRFYIVLDRYEYQGTEEQPAIKRELEDLKGRYYSIVRKLIRARAGDDPEKVKAGESLLLQYGFDYAQEKARRQHVAALWDRTPQQMAEETILYTEILRLSQTSTVFTAQRNALLRLLAGIESGLPDIATRDDRLTPLNLDPQIRGVKGGPWGNALGGLNSAASRKKRGGPAGHSIDWNDSPTHSSMLISLNSAGASGQRQQLPPAQQAEFDAKHYIYRAPVGSALINPKNTHTAVHARSSKFPVPKPILASHLQAAHMSPPDGQSQPPATIFSKLDLYPTKLAMPTKENIELIERVFGAATQLIEVQKQLEKVEADLAKEKQRLGPSAASAASNIASGQNTVPLAPKSITVAPSASGTAGSEDISMQAADGATGERGALEVNDTASAGDNENDEDYEDEGDATGDGDGEDDDAMEGVENAANNASGRTASRKRSRSASSSE